MHIAIVDDDAGQRSALIKHIAENEAEYSREHCIDEYSSGEAFLDSARQEHFDIVFMDIYMDGMSGVEAVQQFRRMDADCPIVFTTTSRDHALEAYQLRAMQYLLKPYEGAEIARLFDELGRRLPPRDKGLELKVGRQTVRIRQQDILWADNFQHQVHIHMVSGETVSSRISFGDFCGLLDSDSRFFVCGRGLLVNLAKVSDFDGRCFHIAGSQLPVSRQFADKARRAFADWLFMNERR